LKFPAGQGILPVAARESGLAIHQSGTDAAAAGGGFGFLCRPARSALSGEGGMTKRTSAKHKIDRRMGENIWNRVKSPLNGRRNGPPGAARELGRGGRRPKLSDYGIHLRAKQKLKGFYGDVTEKQFRRTFEEAQRRKGDTGANLMELLERRLDAVVYRAKFVPTVFAARQFVNHGHVRVNGRRVNIPSYRVADGDVVAVKESSREMSLVLEAVESDERDVPGYLDVDHDNMTAVFTRAPEGETEPYYPARMEPNLIVEYYAKN